MQQLGDPRDPEGCHKAVLHVECVLTNLEDLILGTSISRLLQQFAGRPLGDSSLQSSQSELYTGSTVC